MNPVHGVDELSNKRQKASQRQRLIAAMTAACARDGYRDATVAEAIAIAGVSRATFYEYFADKDDCFLAAQSAQRDGLQSHVEAAVLANPEPAAQVAVRSLLDFAAEQPASAQLLTHESLAAGGVAANRHDEMFDHLGEIVEQATRDTSYLVAPKILLAGACHMIWPHLHAGETAVARFAEDFNAWIVSYVMPSAVDASQTTPLHRSTASRFLPEPPLRSPAPLRPGRRVLPQGEVNRNRRERILYATAEAAATSGFLALTVNDVVARAQIARRVFYHYFEDIDDAFVGALEFFAQPLLATVAGAFFATREWPERIWDSGQALLDFLDAYPQIAHAMLVDSFAAAAPATRSIQATERALMLLLEEGYQRPGPVKPPRVTSELVLATITQLASRELRDPNATQLPNQLPCFAAVVLAPFLGAQAASEFIAAKRAAA
jgi:AcrR family transcriptional regulator